MKSFVSTLSALAIALFLVGCGGADAPVETGSSADDMMHAEDAGMLEHEEEPAEGEGDAPAEGE